jgi:uncharacterized membrane protein
MAVSEGHEPGLGIAQVLVATAGADHANEAFFQPATTKVTRELLVHERGQRRALLPQRLDRNLNADNTAITALGQRMERLRLEHERIPALADLMIMLALAFGSTGLAHALAAPLAGAFTGLEWAERLSLSSEFFWIVVLATTFGLLLSLTRARQLEGAGASRLGSAFLYVLIATVGMQMDIGAMYTNPALFGIGFTWIAFHAVVMLTVARLIKAPTLFLAVGSQANIGGAVSAPVVAAAFHPSLAPVGVLLAVLGYALGTYGAWLAGQLMRLVSQ